MQVIKRLTDEFDDDQYPLIRTGPDWKKFRANSAEFLEVCELILFP